METFQSFCTFEARRFSCRRNWIIVGLLFFVVLVFVQVSVWRYENTLKRKQQFQLIEREKVSRMINYRVYGVYGYRTIFLAAPVSILFIDSAVVPEITSFVDSGERLNIYLEMTGKHIFDLKKSGFMEFSGIILFFGSLLSLLYGFDTFGSREFRKFLASISGKRKVFRSTLASRVLILAILFLALIAAALGLIAINGFYIPFDKYLVFFIGMVWGLTTFFFILGAVFSPAKNRGMAMTISLVTWFLLVFIIPDTLDTLTAGFADRITPVYQLEREKINILANFEKKAVEIAGIYGYNGEVNEIKRKIMLGYLDKEFKRIEELERDMRRQMKAVISRFHFWSVFFPTTFYRSVNNEISTRGYKNLVDFYKRAQDQKSGFVRYCIKKVFFSNFSKVVPYLTGDQNVYRAGGRLPGNAVPGILLTVLYIMGSAAIAYIRFCKALFQLPENRFEQPKEGKVELKQGEFRPFAVEGDLLSDQMYCLLSGETGELKKSPLDYKISLDGVDLSGNKRRRNFIYLPHPDDIPGDIKVNDLIDLAGNLLKIDTLEIREAFNRHNGQSLLNKSFESLKRIEKGEFLLALLSTGPKDIYHINDISSGIHPVFDVRLKSRMEGLIQRGALVIFLTHDDILRMKSLDTGQYFYPAHSWCNIVDRYAGMDEMRKALAIYEQ